MVDRRYLLPAILDLHRDAELVLRVDHVAEGAPLRIPRPIGALRLAVLPGDHPAALVGDVLTGMGDDLIEQRPGDPHGRLRLPTAFGNSGSSRVRKRTSPPRRAESQTSRRPPTFG